MTSQIQGWVHAFLLALALTTSAHGSDVLLNSNFAEGKAHWHGDGAETEGGLVITLKPDKWTAITQRFNSNSTALKLNVVYTLSDDCTLGKTGDKLVTPLTSDALNQACGVSTLINVPLSKFELWKVIVASGGLLVSEDFVTKTRGNGSSDTASGDKTYTSDLNAWLGSAFVDCNLCLCFPPGQGTVTLRSVKLLPPGQ